MSGRFGLVVLRNLRRAGVRSIPWLSIIERETIMKVARRKNMMSMKGIISRRGLRPARGEGMAGMLYLS